MKKVAVIGAGLMGSGIAQTVARAGIEVTNIDISGEQIKNAEKKVAATLDKLVSKGKMSPEEVKDMLGKLRYSSSYQDAKEANLIIEAVPEKMDLKKKVFSELDKIADENTIIISNTSGLSISEMASVTKRPGKVMGVHFFYPAPIMKLVELIRGIGTTEETFNVVKGFSLKINKEPVEAPELPGFLVNRILVPMMNEGAFCVMEGAKAEDVDKAMKLGANLPMGPLELADFVGLDVMLATMEGLYQGFADSKYRPCPLIKTLVSAGHLGRKSGKGFYKYN
ncbi:3-hydroxyacyl-CoA dehydrogenase NAD-binding domain-containing protein [Petroclostridium sp. X23]|uniref:3-hydroxyacyl-CoA dehydrogenase family protein n=1 Tax=Petroclostridium sp. X23 TaxID=3045146 RepID=UPI0024ADD9F6|nr:3-hydroxyacyl-CoA dehydrogenase NAD-binding domain-containing protein [Petroclostridium sp. X23]WHH61792.1 3-hydroxyacyl-CoA dehydrogenase NAD-binding domain-containing protein [Petroclostridium sp. X23]